MYSNSHLFSECPKHCAMGGCIVNEAGKAICETCQPGYHSTADMMACEGKKKEKKKI